MNFYASFYPTNKNALCLYNVQSQKGIGCYSFENKKLRDAFVEKTNFVFGEGTSAALTKAEALRKFGYTDSCSNRVVKTETHIMDDSPILEFLKKKMGDSV